ncbi:phosphate ABC transporter permease PstA [Halieaceae bacterium IMCC8485]|jgi:phosphate transport system permease protein|uniref:Phosphate transport system permease protein PstA n=1 Tax=Candidatus Seongchinamella marina TaxID=2518990 RepID=A0ABT3SUJ7_9GAMM|nr:phosphate ABC transporter permease PstA [Candidatus Seongchinamella marina]MCX2973321.1 phosphate ABC transporter permease PstA [Candidatus Seongchinamella marina]
MTKDRFKNTALIQASLKKRYARERRFQMYGKLAVLAGFVFLFVLLFDIVSKGTPAFTQQHISIAVNIDVDALGVSSTASHDEISKADFSSLIKSSLREMFPDVKSRGDKRQLYRLVSIGAEYDLRDKVLADPTLLGKKQDIWMLAHSQAASYLKGQITRVIPEAERKVKNQQMDWLDRLREQGRTKSSFNTTFFTYGDSREPELAGIRAALQGSLFTLMVTFLLAFPIGVFAAVYLEEFAPRNRLTDLIEININNLAAVPSIVFGLLGLAVFINFFELPRSAPLVGGIVLSLMTLPTIIITSRAAIQAVSPSIREAALGVGASKLQTVFHHVLPVAMPGILTGSIIGMAQALGESAPLLMIGMVAFIMDVPGGVTDSSTVLPVQIYLWADSPERGFTEKTSAAIMVLMGFLILMNALAIILRKRFELK